MKPKSFASSRERERGDIMPLVPAPQGRIVHDDQAIVGIAGNVVGMDFRAGPRP